MSRFVGVRDALKSAFTVRETLRLQAGIAGAHEGAGMAEALSAFRLERLADMPCGYLSSGQRKRAALASLVHAGRERPLWLLDEPTNALDGDACAMLAEAVARHRGRGGIVIAATHLSLGWPDSRDVRIGGGVTAGDAA
jgi:heme exporter protein A